MTTFQSASSRRLELPPSGGRDYEGFLERCGGLKLQMRHIKIYDIKINNLL